MRQVFFNLFLTPIGRVDEDQDQDQITYLSFFPKILKFWQNFQKKFIVNISKFFCFENIFFDKNGTKSTTPLKILSFEEKI